MGREEWVTQRWKSLCLDLGVQEDLSEIWGQRIQEGYSGKGRYYHTLEHIANMLESAERDFDITLRRPLLVHLAIFFHDLVYEPKSGTNEEDSEALFRTFSDAAGLSSSDIRTVSEYIIATKRHDVLGSDDKDLRTFIDLDMAVVGWERSAYLTYASQIRQEYIHVPAGVYCQKRAEILHGFLATGTIFATETYQHNFEAAARSNVEAEVALLSKGVIPGHP